MAVKAQLFHDDGMVVLGLYPGEQREWIGDEPDERSWPFEVEWDAPKLERGEYELGVLEVPDVSLVTDVWLAELDKLALPRVDVTEAGSSMRASAMSCAGHARPIRVAMHGQSHSSR